MSYLAKSKCSSLRNELRWLPCGPVSRSSPSLSVLSALIATSRYYNIGKVMPLLVPLLLVNLGLVVLGSSLVFRSIHRIHHYERRIRELSEKYRSIAESIE